MYHTEGFVNKRAMNAEKHIVMLALEEDGRPWYLWCVMKESIVKTELIRQVLSFWLQQTLLTKGCSRPGSVQRELNRLGGYLQKMDKGAAETDDVELFMYYQGRLYQWDMNNGYGMREKMKGYGEITKGVYGYVSEEELWSRYMCDKKGRANMNPEALANAWELSLLEACSTGEIEHGFFLVWEDKSAF